MKRIPLPATLKSLSRIAFSLLCCTLLMVQAAAAQNNEGPPTGAILDLSGTPVPGGGNNTYQQYTVQFQANVANTALTFAIREDPAFISLASVSVNDVTDSDNPGPNLLTNGDFSLGTVGSTPVDWIYANVYGADAGGVVKSSCGVGEDNTYGVGNCWFDGAVQAYDAISQTIPTTVGDTYQISFFVADNSGCGCNFSDLSTNGDTTSTGGNGINVTVYAQAGLPPPAQDTLTLTEAGQGSGTVTDNTSQIDCIDANGVVSETGCSGTYDPGTIVTLTAVPNSPPSTPASTFGGWGGACASFGTNLTCTVTMNSSQNVTAVFNNSGSPTQSGNINTGCPPEDPPPGCSATTTFNFGGGFTEGSPFSGNSFTAQQTDTTQTLLMTVTAIPISQAACNALVRLNPLFNTAECFVIQNGGGLGVDSAVEYAVTCQGESCGSDANPFDALLGSDFNFKCSENSPLLCGPPPLAFSFGPPNLTSANGLPSVGFLKGTGPDESNPCIPIHWRTAVPKQPDRLLTIGDTSSKPIKGGSGGSTSCWVATYLTQNETPSVSITQPVNNDTYQQNQSDATTLANYTCAAVNTGNSPTGPYLTVPPGNCTATDTPGGSVADGAHFDTSTTGPHTFTANVEDSATNTSSSTVTYYVMGAPATKSANYTTFIEGTKGSFTITTSGYPYPSITYSPAGSLPAGVTLVDNHNGTATLSGTPTVSGVFSFWLKLSNGVGTPTLQSFTLTVTAPVSVTPTSLAFGSVTVGQSSKKTVTVQNTSGKTMSIGPTTITFISGTKNQFSVSQACPATLAAGGSCTIGVSFAPTVKTTDAATLSIGTSALANPLNVSLTGTGK